MPGILFTRPKPCDQTDVWSIVGLVSCEQNCCFIMCPIVLYLVDVVNQVKNFMLYLYNTPKNWMRVTDSNCRCTWLMRPVWWPPYPRNYLSLLIPTSWHVSIVADPAFRVNWFWINKSGTALRLKVLNALLHSLPSTDMSDCDQQSSRHCCPIRDVDR